MVTLRHCYQRYVIILWRHGRIFKSLGMVVGSASRKILTKRIDFLTKNVIFGEDLKFEVLIWPTL